MAKLILTNHEKALLDTIAFAEGTLGVSKNGYDVTFNFYRIIGWTEDTKIVHGGTAWKKVIGGTAAGRYQFLHHVWVSRNNDVNAPMTKNNQDAAAMSLIKDKRLPQTFVESRDVSIEEIDDFEKFKIMLNKLAPEWASFPLTKQITRTIDGVKVKVGPNQSYYSADTINESDDSPKELYDVFMKALNAYNAL